MKLSFIVPVYNVEQYIEQCINSLLKQDFQDIEIIIVNDGTKDNSIQIIEKNFIDNRIKIVHQENKGLSEARNTGLKVARGEYVWFFDSDDWLSLFSLSDIVSNLKSEIFYFTRYFEEYEECTKITKRAAVCTKGKDLSKRIFYHPVQFYIFKRDFLIKNNFFFVSGILHEDTLFTPCILYLSDVIVPYQIPKYHLRRRKGSITQTVSSKRCVDLMYVIDQLVVFYENKVKIEDQYCWGQCIADAVNELMMLTRKLDDDLTNRQVSEFVSNKKLSNYCIHSKKIPTKILGLLSKFLNLNLFLLYSKLYNIRYKNRELLTL